MNRLTRADIPPVTQEFIDAMRAAFKPRRYDAKSTHGEMLWAAAQQEVIEWAERFRVNKTVSGNPDDLKPEPKRPWWRRLMFWR